MLENTETNWYEVNEEQLEQMKQAYVAPLGMEDRKETMELLNKAIEARELREALKQMAIQQVGSRSHKPSGARDTATGATGR